MISKEMNSILSRYYFSKMNLIFIIFVVYFLSGCSVIESNGYFAPKPHTILTEKGDNNYSGAIDVLSSGSKSTAVLKGDGWGIRIDVENVEKGTLSFGPLYFPVIPFPFKNHFKSDEFLTVCISLQSQQKPLNVNINELALVLIDKSRLIPKGLYRTEKSDGEFLYKVIFNISPEYLKTFTLVLGNFLNDIKTPLPEIIFEKKSGIIYSVGP